jgi:hypothetical protein
MIRREKVHIEIDDGTIATGDPWAVIQPVWWLATIYHGPAAYEHSLQQFSGSQRLVWAVLWYRQEVNNGGHRQFYSNSTGIVWRDALEGFEALGITRGAKILRISAERLGGSPALDREERNEQLISQDPDFHDLDEAFGDLQKRVDINESIMKFIRDRSSDFYFSGTIERTVLPNLKK